MRRVLKEAAKELGEEAAKKVYEHKDEIAEGVKQAHENWKESKKTLDRIAESQAAQRERQQAESRQFAEEQRRYRAEEKAEQKQLDAEEKKMFGGHDGNDTDGD